MCVSVSFYFCRCSIDRANRLPNEDTAVSVRLKKENDPKSYDVIPPEGDLLLCMI